MDDKQFRQKYRFSKVGVDFILNLIKPSLRPIKVHNLTISEGDQLLTALRYYGTGSLRSPTDLFGMFLTVSKQIVCKVSRLISILAPSFITFPNEVEQNQQCMRFFELAHFPGVIGVIDCIHTRVQKPISFSFKSPTSNGSNQKSVFTISAQVMMNNEYRINNIVTHWSRDVKDNQTFATLELYRKLQDVSRGFWLLGDAGYPCLPFLLTPFVKVNSIAQQNFNIAHMRTHRRLEEGISRWKSRFPILGESLDVKLKYCPLIIVACAVLHNIAILLKEPQFNPVQFETDSSLDAMHYVDPIASLMRQTLVYRYFS